MGGNGGNGGKGWRETRGAKPAVRGEGGCWGGEPPQPTGASGDFPWSRGLKSLDQPPFASP